jgi:tetratricopeptide (TPR) repeat protein
MIACRESFAKMKALTNKAIFAAVLSCSISGCASFSYPAKDPSPPYEEGVYYIRNVPPVAQSAYQCGPAALESVLRYWGKEAPADLITRDLYQPGSRGIFNFMLAQYARSRGFWTQTDDADEAALKSWMLKDIPPIVMLRTGPPLLWVSNFHFIVVKGFDDTHQIFYANTGKAQTQAIADKQFRKRWKSAGRWSLIICPAEKVDWELDAEAAADLAFLLETSRRLDLAEKWYQYALEKNPQKQVARFNLANVYLKTERWDKAENLYLDLLKEKPESAPLSNNLAWVYIEKGKYQEAIHVIQEAFKKGAPRQYDILDTLGLAYCKLRDSKTAQACFREALEKIPSDKAREKQTLLRHLKDCENKPAR